MTHFQADKLRHSPLQAENNSNSNNVSRAIIMTKAIAGSQPTLAVNPPLTCYCFLSVSPSPFIMLALWNSADHYIFILWFLSIFYFSSPNLSGRTWWVEGPVDL